MKRQTPQRLAGRGQAGFSLVELMAALLIVGVLSAIALPAYTNYVKRANRSDAESELLQAGQDLERWYSTHDTYAGFTLTTSSSPRTGTRVYQLQLLPTPTTTTYTVKATPLSTGTNKNNGFLQLLSDGTRTWDKDNNGSISSSERTWSDN